MTPPSREEIVEQLIPYAERLVAQDTPLHALTRHVMGLYQGQAGGRLWRRHLSEKAPRRGDDPSVLREALDVVLAQQKLRAAKLAEAGQ